MKKSKALKTNKEKDFFLKAKNLLNRDFLSTTSSYCCLFLLHFPPFFFSFSFAPLSSPATKVFPPPKKHTHFHSFSISRPSQWGKLNKPLARTHTHSFHLALGKLHLSRQRLKLFRSTLYLLLLPPFATCLCHVACHNRTRSTVNYSKAQTGDKFATFQMPNSCQKHTGIGAALHSLHDRVQVAFPIGLAFPPKLPFLHRIYKEAAQS